MKILVRDRGDPKLKIKNLQREKVRDRKRERRGS